MTASQSSSKACAKCGEVQPLSEFRSWIARGKRCRSARGELNGSARLTESAVREIRSLYASASVSQSELARRYRVNQTTIHDVVQRKAWKHVA